MTKTLGIPSESSEPIIQLRPDTAILRIDDEIIQIGTSPGHSFILTNLSAEDEVWLRRLAREDTKSPVSSKIDSPHRRQRKRTSAKARENTPAETTSSLTTNQKMIVRLLEHYELLVDDEQGTISSTRIRLSGLDKVGIILTRLLPEIGIKYLDLRDKRQIDINVEDLFSASDRGIPREAALQKELSHKGIYTSKLSDPDLTILICDRTIDHFQAGLLLNQDNTFIPVTIDDRSIMVGPLIIPGFTCCHVCLGHHRSMTHANWPYVREMLRKLPPASPSLPLATCVASFTVNLISSIYKNKSKHQAFSGSTLTDPSWFKGLSWRFHEGGIETIRWEPHPDCSCQMNPSPDDVP